MNAPLPLNVLLVVDRNELDRILSYLERVPMRCGPYHHDPNGGDMAPAGTCSYDLCLLTYTPGITAAIDCLRRCDATGDDIPVILLVDGSGIDGQCALIDTGADDYLTNEELDAGLLGRTIRYTIERRRLIGALAKCGNEWNVEMNDIRDVEKKVSDIDRAYMRQREFIATTSHYFRTPLTIIRAELELLQEQRKDDAAIQKSMTRTIKGIDRLDKLVHDLLLLARMKNDVGAADMTRVRLDEIAAMSIAKLSADGRGKNIEWKLMLQEAEIYCDASSMSTAIFCLIDNAVKFSPREGTVTVSTLTEGTNAIFRVEDMGPGIPPENIPKIFNHFHRGDDTGTNGGTGLGLSIATAVVAAHHGNLELRSTPNGTTMTISVPVQAVPAGR